MALIDGVINAYHLDGSGATVTDATGNSDGTAIGTTSVTGVPNLDAARAFNGSSDYIDLNTSYSVSGGNDFTVGLWFKTTDTTTGATLFGVIDAGAPSVDPRIIIRLNQGGSGAAGYGIAGASTFINKDVAGSFNDGDWHCAILEVTTTSQKLYMDNNLHVSSTTNTGDINLPDENFYLGALNLRGVSSGWIDTDMDETVLWNRILTSDERTEFFNSSNGNPYPFLGEPTTQATNVSFSTINPDGGTINWTNGDGEKRAVFIKETTTGEPAPVDDTTYTANTVFESGSQIGGSGWYCVYNDTGTEVTVTNLDSATTYRTMVIEYNNSAGSEAYLTDTATGNPVNQATEGAPTVQATNVFSSVVGTTTMTLDWTRGDGDKITLFAKEDATSGEPSPVEDAVYSADANFGDGDEIAISGWFCIYDGTDTTVNLTGLTPETDYRIMGVEYNE